MLLAACRRAPEPPAEPTPELEPPPAVSSILKTPLNAATTGYTNEAQAESLRAEMMGAREDPPAPRKPSQKERLSQMRDMTQQFSRIRRDMEDAREKSVALPGGTPVLLKKSQDDGGGPLEEEAEGPKSK
ncbi:MAG: hypothetical protein HYZ74_01500 [Elusimicrobia bacterium]|nr:hypothetical protein [Elusimicrobiota bacterium]